MLWYEELLLLFLRAAPERFEIDGGGMVVRGEFGSSEQRRGLWWSWSKQLSGVDVGNACHFYPCSAGSPWSGECSEFR